MERIHFAHSYEDIISVENLLEAWKEFKQGKAKKVDAQEFQMRLMEHILALHRDLRNHIYRHGPYQHFKISDPKPRDIHKASVRDRLLHHALYRKLYPFFDRTFIADSFSCRLGKGTHRAMNRFRTFARQASLNHTRTCFVLKCDIKKFFASIDHGVLLSILNKHISDEDILELLQSIVGSFHSPHSKSWIPAFAGMTGLKGLPLGNLTSQLLVNIYLNEFDQFVKHKLKAKYYIRYADDFIILNRDKNTLEVIVRYIELFLRYRLRLTLHPKKVFIETFASGVDFLGWIHFPNHRVLRTSTKRRMFRRANEYNLTSYFGLCKHGDTFKIQEKINEISVDRR